MTDPGEGERLRSPNGVGFLLGVLPDLCAAEWVLDGRPVSNPIGPDVLASVSRGVRHAFAHSGAGTTRVVDLHAPDDGVAELLRRVSD